MHLGSHGRGLAGQKRVPLYGLSFGTADASVGEPVRRNLGPLSVAFGDSTAGFKPTLWDAREEASATRAGTHFAPRPDVCATPSNTEADARCRPLRVARPTAAAARCLRKAGQCPTRPQPVATPRTSQRAKRHNKLVSFAAASRTPRHASFPPKLCAATRLQKRAHQKMKGARATLATFRPVGHRFRRQALARGSRDDRGRSPSNKALLGES